MVQDKVACNTCQNSLTNCGPHRISNVNIIIKIPGPIAAVNTLILAYTIQICNLYITFLWFIINSISFLCGSAPVSYFQNWKSSHLNWIFDAINWSLICVCLSPTHHFKQPRLLSYDILKIVPCVAVLFKGMLITALIKMFKQIAHVDSQSAFLLSKNVVYR